ncbi:MAG: type II CAAX endopeptidase family protein [Candidatus Poribacteria bacterium]|nr:type II CAAX endopeptidase family protein [Candidatus Poribacteria bacterium]
MYINPFEKIRFRALVGYAILAFIATGFTVVILGAFLPAWFKGKSAPLRGSVILPLLYVFFCLFTFGMLGRAGLSYRQLCGEFPTWRRLGLYSLWAFPQVIFSLSTFFLLYFPIAFFMPEFFQERFIESDHSTISLSSDKHVLANLLVFLTAVFIAPMVEEFFFRGILLTRWAVKWGVLRSIFASSLVFAILHLDPIGAFCFGCVMAVFYIRTKSLFIPMVIHIANNSIPSIMEWFEILSDASPSETTLEEFQELWWIGLIGFTIITPFAIFFWKHYIRNTDWQVPYLTETAGCGSNANLSD